MAITLGVTPAHYLVTFIPFDNRNILQTIALAHVGQSPSRVPVHMEAIEFQHGIIIVQRSKPWSPCISVVKHVLIRIPFFNNRLYEVGYSRYGQYNINFTREVEHNIEKESFLENMEKFNNFVSEARRYTHRYSDQTNAPVFLTCTL